MSQEIEKELKIGENDDFIIDRKPVALAFCAKPTASEQLPAQKPEKDVVQEILELSNPIKIDNSTEIRRAPSLKSYGCDTESEFELSGEDSDFEDDFRDLRNKAEDTDDEFDRLVKLSHRIMEKIHKSDYPTENDGKRHRKSGKTPKTPNVHEYDDLPPLENLSIECKSSLIEFGKVTKVVDCMVVVEPSSTDVLDFDSYLFDEKGVAIGQVYDIFGQVKSPQYAIRFNSSEEASIIPIDMKVYYAPNEEQFSKTPFKGLNLAAANRDAIEKMNRRLDHQEAIAKAASLQNSEVAVNVIGSDVEFSDDEAEKEYRQSQRNSEAQPNQNQRGNGGNNRKRDRRGGQKVRFSAENQQNQGNSRGNWQNPQPKPYRRDHDVPMETTPAPAALEASEAPKPNSTPSENPVRWKKSNLADVLLEQFASLLRIGFRFARRHRSRGFPGSRGRNRVLRLVRHQAKSDSTKTTRLNQQNTFYF